MKRIAARATSVETLKNGAKLYHLPNGRLVEEVPGKTPYVVKAGTGYGAAKQPPATPPASPVPASGSTTPSSSTSSAASTGDSSSSTASSSTPPASTSG
jgi:hypothetical protein